MPLPKTDMTTILIFLFFGNLIIAGMLAIYSGPSIVQSTYRFYLGGKVFQSVAWALLAMRGRIPDVFSAYLGNSILLAGIAMEAFAMVSVEERNMKWGKYYVAFVLIFIIVFWGFARQANQYVYVASFFAAIIYLSVGVMLLYSSKRSILRRLLIAVFIASCLLLLVRSVNAYLFSDYKLMSNEFSQNLTFLLTYFLMIISGNGFQLLQRERTDELLKIANQELEQLANFDSLTTLANRRKFNEHLTYGISESRRRAEPLALIMADIDFFKNYNDFYGHTAGDKCLVQVAQHLKQHCKRSTDLISRFGGEEFAIVLLNTDLQQACAFAETIRKEIFNLSILHADSGVSDYVTLSLGVFSATPESDEHNYDWYIIEADRRLYNAKRSGRNQCVCI
ncbi:MAG: diguanylate cyclase [Anaerolineales bacterium]